MMRFSMVAVAAAAVISTASPAAAEGDPVAGARVFKRCVACHSLKPDENSIGPSLAGVYGAKAGTKKFNYSKELAASKLVWDEKTLDAYLADPKAVVPNTRMVFKVVKPEDRANLIAYLKTNPTK